MTIILLRVGLVSYYGFMEVELRGKGSMNWNSGQECWVSASEIFSPHTFASRAGFAFLSAIMGWNILPRV